MDILITGIHGFVGSNLTAALGERHCIYGLSTSFSKVEGVIKIFPWQDIDKIPDIDVIIHLVGKAHDTGNKTKTGLYFDINTGLTKEIFDKFLSSKAKKFIFFSSVKAAADSVEGVLTEDFVPSPRGAYGESKFAAEEYIRSILASMPLPDKQVYILRPCMIHGPGNRGNLNLLYNVARRGLPWPLGAFDNRRSFTSIDNLIYILKNIVERNVAPGLYNIADDGVLSTNKIIQMMCEINSKKCRILRINKKIIKCAASAGSIFRLPLNRDRLKKLTEDYIVSNEKIKKALGIEFLPLSAEKGLIKTLSYFASRA
ncbi:MAG: NAD-dependent epimerase/dehydratase family protein [Bacteroidales bacterium]|jgi:nucleoside-diphosphate-sugar epimerase|nr:NAD-dependent epimerase/dehydratase family protein [Bacteroidales bacterium]